MAKILFETLWAVQILLKFDTSKIKNCDVIITSFETSSTHIYPIEGCYWQFIILESIYEHFFWKRKIKPKDVKFDRSK